MQVTQETCPILMNSAFCYAIYMQRSDMQILKAYISVNGGLDIHFSVSTDDSANVLGAPIIFSSPSTTYSLTGNCFTALNRVTSIKKQPPMMALGNTCGLLPFSSSSAACSTPLNNPFITEIASSSYLLPQGLSSRIQHQSLLQIFGSQAGGMPLYRQILDNTHLGTVPIDFVELPGTGDVIYITATTLGLITSKGIVFMDVHNPGYCRATKAILCPYGYFGSVGGVCRPCSQMDQTVSSQIQCTGVSQRGRRLLSSSFQSPPYTQMTHIVNRAVTQDVLNVLTDYYLLSKGFNCSGSASAVSGHQPYNMQADYMEAQMPLPTNQAIPQLIAKANNLYGRNFSQMVSDEYLLIWSMPNSSLVDAALKYTPPGPLSAVASEQCNISNSTVELLSASPCMFLINKDFHRYWLPCALQALDAPSSTARRRALLQQTSTGAGGVLVEHSQCTFMSSTTVSYGILSSSPSPPSTGNNNGNGNSGSSTGASSPATSLFIILAGLGSGLIITLLAVILIYFLVVRHRANMEGRPTTPGNLKSA